MYESHMTCLRKGLEAGAGRIVVFEDDILFDRFDAGRFNQCTGFLSAHPDWQVLLLGGLIRSSKKTANPCVQKVRYQSPVSYTHLRAHETDSYLVCRLLLEKKK